MKKEIIIGIVFCVAGILCACFFGYEYFSTYGFLNEYHMQSFADAELNIPFLLGNIIWERGKFFLLVFLLACTPAKKITPLILRCAICFTAGIFLAACVLNMGVAGILFFLVSWLPHGLLYLLALILIFHVDSHRFYNRKNPSLKKIALYASIIVIVLVGCSLEAVLGTRLLRWSVGLALKLGKSQ